MSNYVFKSEDIATGAPGYVAPLSVDFSPDGMLRCPEPSVTFLH